MRPTLKEISDFALERVDRERLKQNKTDSDKIYICNARRTSKKFPKEVTIFVCFKYYGYSSYELCSYFKLVSQTIKHHVHRVNNSKKNLEIAQELIRSLELINKNNFTSYLIEEFSIISGEPNKNIQKLNKLEKWLINRLYEVENK